MHTHFHPATQLGEVLRELEVGYKTIWTTKEDENSRLPSINQMSTKTSETKH